MSGLKVGQPALFKRGGKEADTGEAQLTDIVRVQCLFAPNFARVHDIRIKVERDTHGREYRKFMENPACYEDLPAASLVPLERI